MKLILLNGSSCSGKSTVAKHVLKERGHVFYLSYDALKWSFSQYLHTQHGNDVRTVVTSIAETVFKLKYDVICDSGLFRDWREKIIRLATTHGYEITEINLESDYEILLQRFEERVADALANPNKRITNFSKDRLRELFDTYQREKNPLATVIRTDKQTIEKTVEDIMKLFQTE